MSENEVTIWLTEAEARFLNGCMQHMNQAKILPPDDREASKTAGWLEGIAAKTAAALDSVREPVGGKREHG